MWQRILQNRRGVVVARAVRPPGATTLSAAAWFDFLHARPYQSFDIHGRADVETAVLLFVAGVIVSQLAARARILRRVAVDPSGAFQRVLRRGRPAHAAGAMLSMITAVILSAVALTATSQVSDEPLDEYSSKISLFEDADCDTEEDTPPDRLFLDCLFEHQSTTQKDAAFRGREVAARQADIQAKGNLAIIFGLLGVTFAVCAVASNRGSRTEPTTGTGVTHAPGGVPTPTQSPSQP
ncbi:DUF4118 domain-containing protein [Streptomyces sp. NPDC051217]|uniref:DUF4118 domain-containing protein n=1 Tax=Streptomyces sp. NPDC051217 TaxID=3365644 RepID=UPI00379EEC40